MLMMRSETRKSCSRNNMIVNFQNVEISIEASSPEEAYTKLCDLLADNHSVDWYTDTYTVNDGMEVRDTGELFNDGERRMNHD